MKKAQVETMGLVIIVALLAFILVFVLQSLAEPAQNTLQARYLQLNADNLRSTILKTTLCQDTSLKDEIINCNEFDYAKCENLNPNCKDKLGNIVKEIIENSLQAKNYKFEAGEIKIEKNFNSCKNIYKAVQEPIPDSDIKINLGIC